MFRRARAASRIAVPLAIRTIRGAREKIFRAHRARRLTLRRRGRRFRFIPGMVSDQGCENDADSQQFMEADIPADCAGSGWRSGRTKSHSAQKKSYRNCELAH